MQGMASAWFGPHMLRQVQVAGDDVYVPVTEVLLQVRGYLAPHFLIVVAEAFAIGRVGYKPPCWSWRIHRAGITQFKVDRPAGQMGPLQVATVRLNGGVSEIHANQRRFPARTDLFARLSFKVTPVARVVIV